MLKSSHDYEAAEHGNLEFSISNEIFSSKHCTDTGITVIGGEAEDERMK